MALVDFEDLVPLARSVWEGVSRRWPWWTLVPLGKAVWEGVGDGPGGLRDFKSPAMLLALSLQYVVSRYELSACCHDPNHDGFGIHPLEL